MKANILSRTSVLATAAVIAAVLSLTAPASAQTRISTDAAESVHAGEFVVNVNGSQVLRLDETFTDLLVGNPAIADVLPLSDRSIYVLGKATGKTSLTIRDGGQLVAVADLVVRHDVEGLKERLFEMLPDEEIEIRAVNGSIMLSGTVSSPARLDDILTVAKSYAPDRVRNLLTVAGSQQVMLQVRFVEVSRNAVKDFGLNTFGFDPDFPVAFLTGDNITGNIGVDLITGDLTPAATVTAPANSFLFGAATGRLGSLTLGLLFNALEQKGVAKVIAEPNLIAMSGDTATFLAGGEFPVPVAQDTEDGGSTITVEFKEFGISLAFTPTVLDNGMINLVASPEVSRIDRTLSVITSGFNIPGVATRRATTTVELRDGEAFAIAGLLSSNFQDSIRQLPGIGDVPVLGALSRSSNFRKNETELVIIVEPHLVQPAAAGTLATPADNFVPPSDLDIFLNGRVEAPTSGVATGTPTATAVAVEALNKQSAGGIEGTYGHILK